MKPKTILLTREAILGEIFILLSVLGLFLWGMTQGTTSIGHPYCVIQTIYGPTSQAPRDLEQAEQIRELLNNNGGCELPCLIGITPGKSTWGQVMQIFTPFDLEDNLAELPSGKRVDVFDWTQVMNVALDLRFESGSAAPVADDIVRSIFMRVLANEMKAGTRYTQFMEYYFPANILTRLGKPTQIWVQIIPPKNIDYRRVFDADSGLECDRPQYYLVLVYEPLGLTVRYQWSIEEPGKKLTLCPGKGLAVSVYSHPQMRSFTAEEIFADLPYYPLEEATGMDIDAFYETFKHPGAQQCLETPARLWRGK